MISLILELFLAIDATTLVLLVMLMVTTSVSAWESWIEHLLYWFLHVPEHKSFHLIQYFADKGSRDLFAATKKFSSVPGGNVYVEVDEETPKR